MIPGTSEQKEMAPVPGTLDWADWYSRNFGYQGSFLDRVFGNTTSLVPPGSARTTVKIATYPVRSALQEVGVLPTPIKTDDSLQQAQIALRKQLEGLAMRLAPQQGPTTIRLPGAATPIAGPNLPTAPDLSAARTTLEAAAPVAPTLPTDQERFQSFFGGAAAGARGAQNVGEVLLGAGAGAAAARSRLSEQERAATERAEERQREHQIRIAQLEVDDAKTRYTAEWQKSVLDWQIAVKNAEAAKPQVQMTRGGLLMSVKEGNDRVVKFMPFGTLAAAGDVSDVTKASAPGGMGWLKSAQAYISTFPDKTVGVAVWTANMLRKGGHIYPTGAELGDLKETAIDGNAELGFTDKQVKQMVMLTQEQLKQLGLEPGSAYYAKQFGAMFDVNVGQTLLRNPQAFAKSFSKITGSNLSKQ